VSGVVPTPRTFSPSEIQTGAYLNSVRDWANFLLDPPHFKGSITAGTTLGTGTNIAYPSIEDNYGGWDATNHWYTVPAGCPGLYLVNIQFKWNTAPAALPTIIAMKTGVSAMVSANASATTAATGVQMTGMLRVAAGDQIAVRLNNAGFTTLADTGDNNYLNFAFYAK
jgi:hypothetical protein